MELTINTERKSNALIVTLSGRLTYGTTPEFDSCFDDLTEDITEIMVDMSGLIYISSMGIRSIIHIRNISQNQGISFKIISPSKMVMDVFSLTGLDKIIDIVTPEKTENGSETYPLRPIQRWMMDTQFVKARSTMTNVGSLLHLEPTVDLQTLAKVINSVIADNDIFRCRFVLDKKTGDIYQRFDGEVTPVIVEEMTSEDFEKAKGKLRKPYKIIDHQLWNIRVFDTTDGKYLLIDFFNGLMDGVAIVMLFWREVNRRYTSLMKGSPEAKNGTRSRRSSSYAAYIEEEMKTPKELTEEGNAYWQKMLCGFDPVTSLPPMDNGNNMENGLDEFEVPISDIDKTFFSGKNFNEHTYFLGVTLLTMAKQTHRPEAIMSWVHNGRTTKSEMGIMGIMLEQFPIRGDFIPGQTASEFLSSLGDRIKESMRYRKSLDYVYSTGLEDETACFIFQKGAIGRRGKIKLGDTWAELHTLDDEYEQGAESTIDIELNAHDDGSYSLVMHYNTGCYSKNAMTDFAETFCRIAETMKDESCDLYSLLGL